MEEPIVYMKVLNEQGSYIDKDGKRYDILTCHHTESREQVQVGTKVEEDEEGNLIEVPVYQSQVVINKGWDNFDSLEQAMEAYGVEEYHEHVIEEAIDVPAEVVEEEPEQPQEEIKQEQKQPEEEQEEESEVEDEQQPSNEAL